MRATGTLPPRGFVSLLAMFGSFLLVVHNSPAAPAADEIRVQKSASFPTRLRLGLGGVLSWISPCVFFRKPRPTLAGQGRVKSEKNAVGFGIICGIIRG